MKTLLRLLEPAFNNKKVWFKAIIQALNISITWIISVYILKEITNKIQNWWSQEILNLLIIFIVTLIIFYILVVKTRHWTHVSIWPTFRTYLYKKYIKYYIYLDNNEAEKIWTWKMIAMVDKWIMSWILLAELLLTEVLLNTTFIIFSFIFISFINLQYAIVIFIIFMITFFLTISLQAKAKVYRNYRRDENIFITKKFVNILMSKFEILQNGKYDKEISTITNTLDKVFNYNKLVQNHTIITVFLMNFIIDLSKIMVIIMFGYWLWWETISIWEFVSLMSIVYIMDQIFRKSLDLYINFTKTIVDVEKLWEFFDHAPQIEWYENWKKFHHKKWDIKIENLGFWYIKHKKIFENFSLKIDGEKVLALVWDSGSGKSTLAKIIAWYMKPNHWEIIIDEQKLSETSLKSYYEDIWYLTQDPSVFDGSILENLTYALEEKVPNDQINEIIKQAKCEFIYDLPKGLETEIWERWVKLSGWQKQRLAIAKIFLKDPKIIILDEPTSALDSFSEEQITKAMQNLFENRTVIVIAHRLQTVKHADRILVLESWKIIEDGKHDELVEKNWKYAKMLELQSWF